MVQSHYGSLAYADPRKDSKVTNRYREPLLEDMVDALCRRPL